VALLVDFHVSAAGDLEPDANDDSAGVWTSASITSALTGITTSPTGALHTLDWNAFADSSRGGLATAHYVTAPGTGAQALVVAPAPLVFVRVEATDAAHAVATRTRAGPFAIGNSVASVALTAPARATGNVDLTIALSDAVIADVVPHVIIERSVDGGSFQEIGHTLIAPDNLACGLAPAVQPYIVAWDTRADLGNIDATVQLRARVEEEHTGGASIEFGFLSGAVSLAVENDTPTRVVPLFVHGGGTVRNGAIAISYLLVDDESDDADVQLEFSTDTSDTFFPCTEWHSPWSEGEKALAASPDGVEHTFVWETGSDLPVQRGDVTLRVRARDASGLEAEPVVVFTGETAGPAAGFDAGRFDVEPINGNFGGNTAIAAGDLNGDGVFDAVVATGGGTELVERFGAFTLDRWEVGGGTAPVALTMPQTIGALRVVDVTCDRRADVLVEQAPNAFLARNTGGGALASAVALSATFSPRGAPFVGDFNHDGLTDLASSVGIVLGTGSANNCSPTAASALPMNELAVGNINSKNGDDPFDDIVANLAGTTTLTPLFGQAAGSSPVLRAGTPFGSGGLGGAIGLGDLDGDGDLDVAAATPDQQVTIYENVDGRGTFAPLCDGPAPVGDATFLGVTDFDADGIADLFYRVDVSSIVVFRGAGDGCTFVRVYDTSVPNSSPATLVDVDGDGLLDILDLDGDGFGRLRATAGRFATVAVGSVELFSDGGRTLWGDVDRDGVVDAINLAETDGTGSIELASRAGRAGVGTFAPAVPFDTGQQALVCGQGLGDTVPCPLLDLTGRGLLDLVALGTATDASKHLIVEELDPDAGSSLLFTSPSLLFTANALAAGDIDNDGAVDVVLCGAAGAGTQLIALARGTGDDSGDFGAPANVLQQTGTAFDRCFIGDFNGDAALDILATSFNDKFVELLGKGDGTFAAPIQVGTSIAGQSFNVRDVDTNGFDDVILVGGETDAGLGRTTVFFSDGASGHLTETQFGSVSLTSHAVATDVNLDGQVDVLTEARGAGLSMTLVPQEADEFFINGGSSAAAGTLTQPDPAFDADGDGIADFVTNQGAIVVPLLRTTSVTPWTHTLKNAEVVGGDTLPLDADTQTAHTVPDLALADHFGRSAASISIRIFGGGGELGADDPHLGNAAFGHDFVSLLRQSPLRVAGTLNLLTFAFSATGDAEVVRVRDPAGGSASVLDVRNRFGPRTNPTDPSDLSRAGLDLSSAQDRRGVIFDLPFITGHTATTVRVFERTMTYAVSGDRVTRAYSWIEIPAAPSGIVQNSVGPSFAVDAASGVVHVAVDKLGVIEAFNTL
jgi:hypothetical protein